MAVWYLGSTKHTAVAQWAASTAYSANDLVRQLAAPSVGDERVFKAGGAGTSSGSEPSWDLNQGATTVDNDITWTEVTGDTAEGWNAAAARQALFCNAGSSWAAAGDTVYRSDNHAETQSSNMTLNSPGTAVLPLRIYTVVDTAAPPTATATTASVSTTTNRSITFLGFAYDFGCTYDAGSGASTASIQFNATTPYWWRFEQALFTFATTGTQSIKIGVNGLSLDDRLVEFIDCDISFNNTAGGITVGTPFLWKGGQLLGTAVTNLFINSTVGPGGIVEVLGVDLSLLNAGENLVEIQQGQPVQFNFENCKLGASVTVTTGTVIGQGGSIVRMVNCDSADTTERYHYQDFQGTVIEETTIKINNVSRKIVTTADSEIFKPLVLDPIIIFNSTLSSLTATVEIVNDGITLQDDEIWLEVEYLGTSGVPLSLFENDRVVDPVFGTPANQTTSTVPWVTTGLSSPIKQKLEVTFTPAEIGVIKLRIHVARQSTTLYIDPKATIA